MESAFHSSFAGLVEFAANQEIERISAHIDLLPTLADIAGIEKLPKGQVEGRSLVPLLKNPRRSGRIATSLLRLLDGKRDPSQRIGCGRVLRSETRGIDLWRTASTI